MSLPYIGQQITIYFRWFVVIIGIIGNSLNIWIFSSVRTYYRTFCTFYFLIASIDNILYLTTVSISRIIMSGHQIDLTRTSLVWCKIRLYCSSIFVLMSFTCSYLTAIDQFFITSSNVRLRQWSHIKRAHRIIFILILIWLLHGIPGLIFGNITSSTNICMVTNNGYTTYISIYVLTYNSFVLIAFTTAFGYLTYRNIHSRRILAERQVDLQVVKMTLIQIILIAISISPYGIYNAYLVASSQFVKNTDQIVKETFASTITTLFTNVYYSGSFYVFLISSQRFRREIRNRICFWRRTNRILSVQQRTI
ncbi:unnamed protein product [Adineta ricciae]|uniref:G-protein coupled receptors family 1 profile domain-containing protein n=1 Tax=Adineta ricciae TaxID=249248 RepID=A0A816BEM6_ADIRI|nr:unnamed protein product [Adineta ricciae]